MGLFHSLWLLGNFFWTWQLFPHHVYHSSRTCKRCIRFSAHIFFPYSLIAGLLFTWVMCISELTNENLNQIPTNKTAESYDNWEALEIFTSHLALFRSTAVVAVERKNDKANDHSDRATFHWEKLAEGPVWRESSWCPFLCSIPTFYL